MRAFQPQLVPRPNLIAKFYACGFSQKLDLEIGAGQGLHAIRYAQLNPTRTLIAIEQTKNRYAQLKQRHEAHPSLTNLISVRADAVAFVVHHIPQKSIQRVFLLYPNPYPKQKQANLRWVNSPFFGHLLEKMQANSEITLATNLRWYANEARTILQKTWQLVEVEFHPLNAKTPPRTHFEKKYLERGEVCWHLKFKKLNDWQNPFQSLPQNETK